MSSNRIIDVSVQKRFPYPVAAAWHRVLVTSSSGGRQRALFFTLEVLLRTLCSYQLLDYLRGPKDDRIEAFFPRLERQSLGTTWEIVRETTRHLNTRADPAPFLPELFETLYTSHGKQSSICKEVHAMVDERNRTIGHPDKVQTGKALDKATAKLRAKMRLLLDDLRWMEGYRILRIVSARQTRQGSKGLVAEYTGHNPLPAPEMMGWDGPFIEGCTYLVHPDGSEALELTPMIRVLEDQALADDRLFLFRGTRDRAQAVELTNVETGTTTKQRVEQDEEMPFSRFWQSAPIAGLYVQNQAPSEGFCSPDVAEDGWIDERFELRGSLGRGGMAVVHLAWDAFREREVALKILLTGNSEDTAFRRRFKQEARTMGQLDHPHILRVHDQGNLEDGRLYLTMPVATGGDLTDRMLHGKVDEAQAHQWMLQMASAVVFLHSQDPPITHRDVKPSNFLLDEEGAIYLSDFGVAFQENQMRLTRTSQQLGSQAYMSPEQSRTSKVTPLTDIYSLGVVFHELLTGNQETLAYGKDVPAPIGPLIVRMTKRLAEERPSAEEVLAELRATLMPEKEDAEADTDSEELVLDVDTSSPDAETPQTAETATTDLNPPPDFTEEATLPGRLKVQAEGIVQGERDITQVSPPPATTTPAPTKERKTRPWMYILLGCSLPVLIPMLVGIIMAIVSSDEEEVTVTPGTAEIAKGWEKLELYKTSKSANKEQPDLILEANSLARSAYKQSPTDDAMALIALTQVWGNRWHMLSKEDFNLTLWEQDAAFTKSALDTNKPAAYLAQALVLAYGCHLKGTAPDPTQGTCQEAVAAFSNAKTNMGTAPGWLRFELVWMEADFWLRFAWWADKKRKRNLAETYWGNIRDVCNTPIEPMTSAPVNDEELMVSCLYAAGALRETEAWLMWARKLREDDIKDHRRTRGSTLKNIFRSATPKCVSPRLKLRRSDNYKEFPQIDPRNEAHPYCAKAGLIALGCAEESKVFDVWRTKLPKKYQKLWTQLLKADKLTPTTDKCYL